MFNLQIYSYSSRNFDYADELTLEDFLNPEKWQFTLSGLYDGEIEFIFCPKCWTHFDQSLPFDFGDNAEIPYEATVSISERLKEEFEQYAVSCKFSLVDRWWKE